MEWRGKTTARVHFSQSQPQIFYVAAGPWNNLYSYLLIYIKDFEQQFCVNSAFVTLIQSSGLHVVMQGTPWRDT